MDKKGINGLIPNELTGFRKIFFSISSYISSLLDIGYGSGSDKATATVLVLASVFLSIASGYTTYSGLTQYTPSIIAGLITLGVQGLLFGVSWRLGKLYIAGEINPAMWAIWAVTMLVSVFFSYSSLFSTVYSENERAENRDIASITIGNSMLRSIENDLQDEFSNKKLSIDTKSYAKWKNKTIETIKKAKNYGEKELVRRVGHYKILLGKYTQELDFGGTEYINSKGVKAVTGAGSGKTADKYKRDAEEYNQYDLQPYKAISEKILKLRELIYRDMADFEKSKDVEKLNIAYENCVNLITKVGGKLFTCNPDLLGKSFRDLVEVQNRYDNFKSKCTTEVIKTSFSSNLLELRKCVNTAKLSEEKTEKYLDKISNFQRNEGEHTHFFIIVVNELKRLNYLSIGTLILAITIDLLILLCSLVASKHNTFLSITSGKDLLQMKNYPLDIILGTDTQVNDNDNEMTRRIKFILNNSKFSLEYLDKKCSMIIPMEKILELNMHKELGTFFSMDLARPFDNGKVIGFRTNFILWMCEQISRKKQSRKSFNELHKAFTGDKNGER